MAMTLSEYDAFIRELEHKEAQNPRAYKLRVAGLALLGFGYVILVSLLVTGLWVAAAILGFVFGKLVLTLTCGLGALWSVWSFGHLLFIRISPPQGELLARSAAPRLFAAIDEVRGALRAPRIHEVRITADYNAAMFQTPRLGILGWQRNTLVLGMPLLMSLEPGELSSVIAHELGHAAGQHSRFSGWIYRLRGTLDRVTAQIQVQARSPLLFKRFFERYIPYFNAYTFVLARANEYVADEAARAVTDAETAGRALLRVHLDSAWLDEHFWKSLDEKNKLHASAPTRIFHQLSDALHTARDQEDARQELERVCEQRTDFADTHPSLKSRLDALGHTPHIPDPVRERASSLLPEALLESLLETFDTQWHAAASPHWHASHVLHQEQLLRIQVLEAKGAQESEDDDTRSEAALDALSPDEFMEYALLIEAQRGKEQAMQLYQRHLAAHPDAANAQYAIGRLTLADKDDAGIPMLERAMALDQMFTGAVCELILQHVYLVHDDKERAQVWLERRDGWEEKLRLASLERAVVVQKDVFLPVALSAQEIAAFTEKISLFEDVKNAWLVQKQLAHFPDKPLLIVGIQPKRLRAFTPAKQQALIQRVANALSLPHDILVFNLADSNFGWMRRKIKRVSGSHLDLSL